MQLVDSAVLVSPGLTGDASEGWPDGMSLKTRVGGAACKAVCRVNGTE